MYWNERRQRIFGWTFLIAVSVLGAVFNFSTGGEATEAESTPAVWQLVLGWAALGAFYLPAYGVLLLGVRWFRWPLPEWGFQLSRRSWRPWLAVVPAAATVAYLWIGPVFLNGTAPAGPGQAWPMGIFQGYARVAEELIFRGFALVFLMRMLPERRSRAVLAVVISSALFAMTHTHMDALRMLNLFLGAAIPIAVITLYTRSLSLAFVLHGSAGGGPIGALIGFLFWAVLTWIGRRRESGRS